MGAYNIRKERCLFQLAPQLTGKAQQMCTSLPPKDGKDYDAVKAAILR